MFLLAGSFFAAHAEPTPSGASVIDFASYNPDKTGGELVTDLFNKAVGDVAKDPAKDTLVIPAGVYRIASGMLQSGVKLYLSKDAVLLGSKNKDDYLMSAPTGTTTGRAMLVVKDCSDVVIYGPGTIDGNFWTKYGGTKDGAAKNNILLVNAENVTIRGVTSIDHTMWNTIVYKCRKVLIDDVTITTHPESPNAEDGIDILSSNDVEVKHCKITVKDDCITVKNKEMDRAPVDMSNIYIHDNELASDLVAALKVGTESTPGTWTNIRFENNNCLEGNLKVIVSDGVVLKDLVVKGNTFHKNTDGARHDTWGERNDILIMVDDRHYGVLGKGPGSGSIENVLIEDCAFLNPVGNNVIAGLNAENTIGTVTFKNVTMGDTRVVDDETARLIKKEWVGNVIFLGTK